MQFKKAGGRIYGVVLNQNEQRAMNNEISRQLVERFSQMELDLIASVLWMLHKQFGFGKTRLKVSYDHMVSDMQELCKRYEMPVDDGTWLCLQNLKDIDCDVEKWYADEMRGRAKSEN